MASIDGPVMNNMMKVNLYQDIASVLGNISLKVRLLFWFLVTRKVSNLQFNLRWIISVKKLRIAKACLNPKQMKEF